MAGSEVWQILLRLLKLLALWAAFGAAFILLRAAYRWAGARLEAWNSRLAASEKLRGWYSLLGEQVAVLGNLTLSLAAASVVLVLLSLLLTWSFGLFPSTEGVSVRLLDWILHALGAAGAGFMDYLPKLGFVLVVIVVTRYVIRVMRVVFRGLGRGVISFRGFHPEWADPTREILSFLIIMFALVVAFPYLPGGDSPALKGVSIFIGVLISLGSGSAVGNLIAGVILTYMRPFNLGDRVQVGDTLGDVLERSLLVTRIRTIKNVEVIVPNSAILSAHILNYSAEARTSGLILHTTVTIGYDAPWRKVHELLIEAARSTRDILPEPAPFVFQTSLNDFHVSYEINAYTREPNRMIDIYAELHQNIQDKFNQAGVEIMSPSYYSLRDGNTVTIPKEFRDAAYRRPGFRLET